MLEAVKSLHDVGFIHRDIKEDNFRVNQGKVFLVDLGSSKEFKDEDSISILKKKSGYQNRGTPATSSIAVS